MKNEITIDGVVYVPKNQKTDGMEYCIVRARYAGVFAGFVKSKAGDEVVLVNSRRIWKWVGAASLSELSVKGVGNPDECLFPCVVPVETVMGVIEIIPASKEAKDSIERVKEWSEN